MPTIVKILEDIEDKPVNITARFTTQIPYLKEDEENERVKNIIVAHLDIIEKDIDDLIFNKIKACNTVDEAIIFFELLHEIHIYLSRIYFIDNVDISEKLIAFIKDFEVAHDEWYMKKNF